MILIISGLDISEDDIRAVHTIYNEVKREDKYKIVWIPVITVESYEEEEEARKKYEYVSSLMKWYIVPYTTKIAGWRYLEENWQLRQDPLVVVMNSKSRVEFTNAIHLIRVWGTEAIPFTNGRINALLGKNWPESTLLKFIEQPRLRSWVRKFLFPFSFTHIYVFSFPKLILIRSLCLGGLIVYMSKFYF